MFCDSAVHLSIRVSIDLHKSRIRGADIAPIRRNFALMSKHTGAKMCFFSTVMVCCTDVYS